jgi:EpsI family protein
MNGKRIVLLVLLAATALVVHARGNGDVVVPSVPLELLPEGIGGWHGTDVSLTPEVLTVLGDGRFLNRTYRAGEATASLADTATASLPIDLLIAYFPSQRSGQSIHSPQNCLPGAGWTFESSGRLAFADDRGTEHRVGEYLLSNGSATLEVLYWYRSRGVDIASDYAAKGYLMVQAIRDRRTDGALIRISTPVMKGEPQAVARARAVRFAASLDPMLAPYLPE